MLIRLFIVITLFIVGFGLYAFMTRRQIKRLAAQDKYTGPVLSQLKEGVPAIVYFTTPYCVPCVTQQQPTLNQLVESVGHDNIQVLKIDATQDPELADHWGVLSAPTTFIVDEKGTTQAVNHGVVNMLKLTQQLNLSI